MAGSGALTLPAIQTKSDTAINFRIIEESAVLPSQSSLSFFSQFIDTCSSGSCSTAFVVQEGEGLRNYNRSCWALARTLMKDARRDLNR